MSSRSTSIFEAIKKGVTLSNEYFIVDVDAISRWKSNGRTSQSDIEEGTSTIALT